MDFITIGQYFNRLQAAILLLLIVPLLVFSTLYIIAPRTAAGPADDHLVAIVCAVMLTWLAALIVPHNKIKSARNAQGLGAKLDKYFKITIVRHGFLAVASLTLALGLYLSGRDWFTWLYFGGMVASFFFWPTGARVCRELALKGDEREMVYFKKDQL